MAVPLESFVNSARTVGGAALVLAARGTAFALRLVCSLVRGLARVAIMLYDLAIVVPLLLERLMKAKAAEKKVEEKEAPELEKAPVLEKSLATRRR